jgi:metallo-beta-lactamase family protein
MGVTMKFCGAAQTVTGSCYLIRTTKSSFLVDCGMFQGPKTLRELNYKPFPFLASDIDFVLQTHAHNDHSGMLPKLTKADFGGKIYATQGTRDLLTFMLPDSGYIQETEVEHLNNRLRRRNKPEVTPTYTRADAEKCLESIFPVDYEKWIDVAENIRARFWNAGHILGSASIEIEISGEETNDGHPLRLLFSGDVGPDEKLFHPDPEAAHGFDYVISESTYGGKVRNHLSPEQRRSELGEIVTEALQHNNMLLIPAFAVERTQELITDLLTLQENGDIPTVPLYLDSPLAIRVTRVFEKHADDLEVLENRPRILENPNVHPTETVEQSKRLSRIKGGAIIMAASGMCDAGRIRHHLKQWLWRRNATILLPGFQAAGTLGRLLADGVKTIKIHGEEIHVKATIKQLEIYSGHADDQELAEWVEERLPIHKNIFLSHGESESIEAFKQTLVARGMDENKILSPELDDEYNLLTGHKKPAPANTKKRLPVGASLQLDWHNDLAQLTIDLRAAFEQAADEKSRAKLLRRMRRALQS